MTTFVAKPGEVEKKWILIDADGLVVGRLAFLQHSNAKRAWHWACLLQVFSISSMAHTND